MQKIGLNVDVDGGRTAVVIAHSDDRIVALGYAVCVQREECYV